MNKDHLRIIIYQDLCKVLNKYEDSNIDSHIEAGLPKNVDKKAVISFLYPKDSRERLHYHVFEKIKDEYHSHRFKKSEYDYPQYISNSPNGYSLWMTLEEYESVCLLNTKPKGVKKPIEHSKPRKENNFCQICKINFDNYDIVLINNIAYRISNAFKIDSKFEDNVF